MTNQDGRHTPNMCTYQYRPSYTFEGRYREEIDVSSVGIIFYELVTGKRFIDLKPIKPAENESKQKRKVRKLKDQQQLHQAIEERLSGGQEFKKTAIQYLADWGTMIESVGANPNDYPIRQFMGLYECIYGKKLR